MKEVKFVKALFTSLFLSLLTGCHLTHEMHTETAMVEEATVHPALLAVDPDIRNYSRYAVSNHNKTLNDYARQIIMELNTRNVIRKPIAVASFVEFDHKLNKTNSIGNQLAEAVLIEMGQMGYPAADINAQSRVGIEEQGNFVFSRKLSGDTDDYCCVLSGNLIYSQNGVRVNAKLINLSNKSLLGASSVTIPYFMLDHLGVARSHQISMQQP